MPMDTILKLQTMTISDADVLARLIYGEARGESLEGQVAVANVVMNRARRGRYGKGIKGVAFRPYQFSCFLDSDPNAKKLLKPEPSIVYTNCETIAKLAILGLLKEVVDGATHYFADSIEMPSWAAKMVFKKKIGHHSFYLET